MEKHVLRHYPHFENTEPLNDPKEVLRLLFSRKWNQVRRVIARGADPPFIEEGHRPDVDLRRHRREAKSWVGRRYLLSWEVVERLLNDGLLEPRTFEGQVVVGEFQLTSLGHTKASEVA